MTSSRASLQPDPGVGRLRFPAKELTRLCSGDSAPGGPLAAEGLLPLHTALGSPNLAPLTLAICKATSCHVLVPLARKSFLVLWARVTRVIRVGPPGRPGRPLCKSLSP